VSGEHDSRAEEEDALATRRKRLRYRSWHRGTREMDLILGRFADAHLGAFATEQLDRYAALLENGDPDLYGWIIGREPVPPEFDHDVMKLLQSFKVHDLSS
jgi:antitoxin CptB